MRLKLLLAGLLAAFITVPWTAPVARAAAPYQIQVIMPLTGWAAFLGRAEQRTLQLIEQQTNATGGIHGRPLQFVFHDDQSSPQAAVQFASPIVAAHPAVLLGSSIVAMCNAMAPLMQAGPVMYCLSPGVHPKTGGYEYSASVSTHALARSLIRYFRLRGWTRLAVLTSTDATGQDAASGIAAALRLPENHGMKLVAETHFNPTDVSVAAQMARIKAAHPQAMIAWSTGAPIATAFKGITESGLAIPVGTTDGNMTHVQMSRYASFLPKQLYIATGEWAYLAGPEVTDPGVKRAQHAFVQAFAQAHVLPDLPGAIGWDPGEIIVAALRALGPNATAAQVHAWIAHQTHFAGIDGVYDFAKFPQRGIGVGNVVVTRWTPAKDAWEPMTAPGGAPLAH